MTRVITGQYPVAQWRCDQCQELMVPPLSPTGDYRHPHPFEMEELGWVIAQGSPIFDKCPECVRL